VVALPAFWLAPMIGTLHDGRTTASPAAGSVTGLGWGAVAALLAQFIGMSSIWAFLERLGHAKGLDPVHLSLALSASAIASMVGSLLVGVLAHRVRGLYGIAAAFALLATSLAAAFLGNGWQIYLVAGVLFMLSWAVYFPFQFGLLANFDRSGALAAIMPAVTGLGFTVGPAIGGVLMARGGIGAILGWGAGCMLISTLACVVLHRVSRSNMHDMVG
jgi:predicted MFS family arabinose efflux permease